MPVPIAHLKRVLDHNHAQAAGLEPGKVLADAPSNVEVGTSSGALGNGKIKNAAVPLSAQGQSWRLATAGGDNHARIWLVHPNIPSPAALAAAAKGPGPIPAPNPPRVEYRATLKRHSGVVNCARFSPSGEILATTGDDGMVLLWIPSDAPTSAFGSALDDDVDADYAKEHWRLRTMARASSSEVYDLAWAPSGDALVTGGTDFVARIINANDGTVIREISEHNHYVQGVTWDPLSEYIATQSSDRSVHVHQLQGRSSSSTTSSAPTAAEIAGIQTVSRNTRMDLHRRTGSGSGHFVWDPNAKPPMKRRASSHASHASDSDREKESHGSQVNQGAGRRTGRSSTPLDIAAASTALSNTLAATPSSSSSASRDASGTVRAVTPTPTQSFAPSPAAPHSASAVHGGMNPPQKTPSRRSSFSGSQAEALSPPTSATSLAPTSHPPSVKHFQQENASMASTTSRSASRNRAMTPRSPSPAPPLPAIRAPPSPKQRIAAVQGGQLTRAGMRLYGDENFSGFFRRLTFSPDGALLVTPTGIFESNSSSVTNPFQSQPTHTPTSPTVAHHPPGTVTASSARRSSEVDFDVASSSAAAVRASPASMTGLGAGSPSPSPVPSHSVATPLQSATPRSTVYMYGRGNLHRSNAPIAHLPGHKTASLVIKFSPILYELRGDGRGTNSESGGIAPHPIVPLEVGKQKTVALCSAASAAGGIASSSSLADDNAEDSHDLPSSTTSQRPCPTSMIGLPYRMVFAVATQDSVWIYDTQQGGPLCCFSNMHYASFTDLTWSPDGQTLMMCSSDGYCSVVVFDYGELGTPYHYSSQPCLQQIPTHPSSSQSSTVVGTTSPRMNSTPRAQVAGLNAGAGPNPLQRQDSSTSSIGASVANNPNALGLGLEQTEPSLSREALEEGEQANPADDLSGSSSKKKRRIAPTLQGPVGS